MKNGYEIRGDVTAIFIDSPKHGKTETLIDTSDLHLAKEFAGNWNIRLSTHMDTFYVYGNVKKGKKITTYYLHRWLTKAPSNMVVDHINHDTLDNRRSINLRVITSAQNLQNRKSGNSKSGVRGVSWSKRNNKWIAQVMVNGKTIHVGYFKELEDAKKAVEKARAEYLPYSKEAHLVS